VLISANMFATSQGRNEVRRHPGQEASLASPCSNLKSLGSKCAVLKKVLVTLLGLFGAPRSHSAPPVVIRRPGNCFPLPPLLPSLRPCHQYNKTFCFGAFDPVGHLILEQWCLHCGCGGKESRSFLHSVWSSAVETRVQTHWHTYSRQRWRLAK